MSVTYEYPRPALAVDCVVFGLGEPNLEVLLFERAEPPCEDRWALPGGHVHVKDDATQGESLEQAACRQLREKTNVEVNYLEQLYTFGDPGRDTRGRVVSVAYYGLVRSQDHVAKAGRKARAARWFSLSDGKKGRSANEVVIDGDDVLVGDESGRWDALAFDHGRVLTTALDRLRAKIRYAPIGFNLLPPKFTLVQLQALYEAILGRPLDRGNFRKKIRTQFMESGLLFECGVETKSAPKQGPAARLYRFDKRAYDRAVRDGFNFEL